MPCRQAAREDGDRLRGPQDLADTCPARRCHRNCGRRPPAPAQRPVAGAARPVARRAMTASVTAVSRCWVAAGPPVRRSGPATSRRTVPTPPTGGVHCGPARVAGDLADGFRRAGQNPLRNLEDVGHDVVLVMVGRYGLQRLGGRRQESGDRRGDVAVDHGTEQRAGGPVIAPVRGVRGGAGEQPGRTGQAADDEYAQTPPGPGVSRAALRPPLRPLDVRRQGRGGADGRHRRRRARRARMCARPPGPSSVRPSSSTFDRWRIRRDSGDIGHSLLVTKRPSEGHADKSEK